MKIRLTFIDEDGKEVTHDVPCSGVSKQWDAHVDSEGTMIETTTTTISLPRAFQIVDVVVIPRSRNG